MKHRNRANQINPIEAKNSQGQTERWKLFKAESGVWTLRTPLGELIEFEKLWNKSLYQIKCCLKNRGLRAEI